MRLKKLELLGFKSFADKTEIAFDKGVTCIVGPNGCGKSNVSDAIRWVLGERSAKLLRGATMEDVIFNGTEVRKPLAFAEVALTIDNSDRGMPIEYNEVTIARRLYRTGESEYLLNKTVCRLKDIQDLILDTGIGSSSYSMIEQGRIDYILKADPEERRFLIEEAAGIAKYKVKKDESIRKLERTEDNLKRLNDIVFEVQRNIQYAERQAKRAERYKQELERLKSLEIKRAFHAQRQIEQKKQDLTQSFQSKKNELVSLETKIQTAHQAIEEQETRVRNIGQRCHVKEGERYQALAQIETNDQKLQFIRDKRVELAQQRGQLLQEQDQLNQSLVASAEKKNEIQTLLASQETKRASIQTRLDEVSATLRHRDQLLLEAKNALESIRQEFFSAAQASTHTRNEFHRCKVLHENLEAQRRREEAAIARHQDQKNIWNEKLRACTESLEAKNFELQNLTAELQSLEGQVQDHEVQGTELERQLHECHLLLREKEARLQALEEIEETSDHSFPDFFQEVSQNLPGLLRDLKEVISIDPGFEWAADLALGQFAHSLIAGDIPTTRLLIEKLREDQTVTTSILVKGATHPHPLPTEIANYYRSLGFRPLADVVRIASEYENAVMPFLKNIFIADVFPLPQLDALLSLFTSGDLISRDGLILSSDRRLFFWNDQNREPLFFSRDTELAHIRQEIESLNTQAQEITSKIETLTATENPARNQCEESEKRKNQLSLEKESLESEKRNIQERLLSLDKELQLSTSEIQNVLQEAQQAAASQERLQQELAQKEQDEKRFHEFQSQKEKDVERLATEREEALNAVRTQQAQADQFEQEMKHLQESFRLVEHHAQKDQDRLTFLAQGLERITSKEQELDQDEESCKRLAEDYQHRLHTIDVELEILKKEQREQDDLLTTQRQELDSVLHAQKLLQDEEHQISLQQMDLDYQLKNVGERLVQRYRLNLSELNPQDYVFTEEELQTAEETITALQNKVDSLGTVNLLAIEEYDELKQRYDFLLAQKKDLEDARDSLMEAIRKINRTTKELFETTFIQVQEAFKQYYQILFRGGEAKLFLIDEEHPLESGIDIVVRPPGKKLQNMSLLSGGEKALTAVALLFALFKIKPSPFSLLDEIDAPLDEANIDRFLTVLRSFLDKSQFIIITHNRKTIAMGDSLYGVTMEEPGVSKIVSVKVRSGDESLPGEDVHPTVAAEMEADTASEQSGTVAA